MSSLLKRISLGRGAPERPSPRRMALGVLVVAGLLSTVFSLAAAGQSGPAGTANLTTAAAATTATQRSATTGTTAATSTTSSSHAMPGRAASGTKAASGTTKTVMIMNYAYSPATLTINVGDTVTWTNMDTAPHTVTVTSGPVKFNSGNLSKGESFSYTFTTAGTYSYYCAVHPDMVAKVVVTGSTTTPTPAPSPSPSPTMPMPSGCDGLEAAADAFLQHFYSAHLETSPTQQLSDALAIDQYTKTHTVLLENMLKPLLGGAQSSLDVFLQHLYAAHLETSPTQQASDALALSQYVKTHTVMIENMIKPLVGQDTSDC